MVENVPHDRIIDVIAGLRTELATAIADSEESCLIANYNSQALLDERKRVDAAEERAATIARERDELASTVEALEAKLSAMAPHSCACSYDNPDDMCFHHSPKLVAALARAEAAERELAEMGAKISAAFLDTDWTQEAKNIIASAKDGDALVNSIRSSLFWTFRAGFDVGEGDGKRAALEEVIDIIEHAQELASRKTIVAAIRALGENEASNG